MRIRAIADELGLLPTGTPGEEEVRASLANLAIGVERRHIEIHRVERRLAEMMAAFDRSRVRDFRVLLREHDIAMSVFGAQDHYYRPGPINSYLDHRALTIQANEDGALGRAWLSPGLRASAVEIEAAFKEGLCVGFVGREERPIWLTPFVGEVADIVGEAEGRFCTPTRRAALARRIVALLGLSHFQPTVEVLAMVTTQTIGELLFNRPDDDVELCPSGSTAIEARGHRRFRPWPELAATSAFGRTYDIDDLERAAAGSPDYGALEAVRPRIAMSDFSRCVFVGPLTARPTDASGAYLEELGIADKSASDILIQLADLMGL